MKEWHGAEVNGERKGSRNGVFPSASIDSEDAAIEAPAVHWMAGDGLAGDAASNEREMESAVTQRQNPDGQDTPSGKERFLARQVERWISSMERLQLSEYMRYVNDRKRMLWSNFLGGVARGLGTAVGFTILGAILVLFLQSLAKRNLPLIGDALAQIVSIVQKRLQ